MSIPPNSTHQARRATTMRNCIASVSIRAAKPIATFAIIILAITAPPRSTSLLADTVTLNPVKDNTLIQPVTIAPANSNALGSIFCGRLSPNGEFARLRLVIAFNLATGPGPNTIPAGSTINSATLTLRLEQGHGGPQTHTLHRLLADWGEGTSAGGGGTGGPATPGDATWVNRFHDTTPWTSPGGDFIASASASTLIDLGLIDYSFTSAQLAADVQAWLDNPASNFGWLMRGNETNLDGTSKKFFSRETPDPNLRPRLVIDFTPPKPPPCPADVNNTGEVDVDDLVMVILAWGPCPTPPAACPADVDDDGDVDVDDLVAVILAWGPCP